MDNRVASRFPTDVEADCRSCDRTWISRLVNVSTTGCMISFPEEDVASGALLRLRVKGLTAIDGEIVWQHRSHAGVRFKSPLHASVIEHLAFRPSDHSQVTRMPTALAQTRSEPRRSAPALHAQLVKRTWGSVEETPRQAASAG